MRQIVIAVIVICMSALFLLACDAPTKGSGSTGESNLSVVSTSDLYAGEAQSSDLESGIDIGKPVLRWAKPGLAPLFISDGADQGGGVGDRVFAQIQALMPQYHHVNLNLNYPRLLEELRKGSDVCAILYHSEEREKFVIYSQPIIATPSYQLYVSAKGLKRFKEKTGWTGGPVSFDDIMSKSKGLTIAITPGQSYGPDRDEVLARHADKAEVIKGYADQDTLVKMLVANRMDMVLGFPWVINYEVNLLEVSTELIKVPLQDMPPYETVFVACADTPLGRAAVAAINNISPPVHTRVKGLLSPWLTDEENQSYLEVYREYFLEGKPLP